MNDRHAGRWSAHEETFSVEAGGVLSQPWWQTAVDVYQFRSLKVVIRVMYDVE